jgi:hypothetical protein
MAGPTSRSHRGRAGPGLLAYVVSLKMGDHLPLYRIQQIFSVKHFHFIESLDSGPAFHIMCGLEAWLIFSALPTA